MTETLAPIIDSITHAFSPTISQSAAPLMVVAAYASGSVILYGLTRGKEFLIAGYSSVLFLVPFIHLA